MIVAEPRTPSYGVAHIGLASISHQPTFCSLLAKGGASAAAIRNLAGHSNVAITDRDMHLAPGEDAAAVRLLGRAAKQEPARRQQRGQMPGVANRGSRLAPAEKIESSQGHSLSPKKKLNYALGFAKYPTTPKLANFQRFFVRGPG